MLLGSFTAFEESLLKYFVKDLNDDDGSCSFSYV